MSLSPVVTVAKLLELPTLSSASVLAGVSGLERPVWNVGVVAGTEITEWVKPGALLLSTGHPLSQRVAALPGIISDLAARGVACLAVRPGTYEFVFGDELLAHADELGFPILKITDKYAFDDILIDVLSRINLALRREADFVEQVHAATTEVLMEGGSLDALTNNMAVLLSARVRVFDPRAGILAAAGGATDDLPSWAELEGTAVDIGTIRETTHNVRLRLGSVNTPLGFLEVSRESVAFGPTELRAAEKAATVVALALAQRSAVQAVESNYRREVLTRVLRGELSDSREIARRFQDIGWDIQEPLAVGLVRLTTGGDAGGREVDQRERALSWLHVFAAPIAASVLAEGTSSGVATVVGSDLVLLSSAQDAERLRGACQRVLTAFERRKSEGLDAQVSVGISCEVPTFGELRVGYQQAEIAVRSAIYRGRAGELLTFGDLGVLGVVLAASTDPAYADYQPDTLSPVEALPAPEREELLLTLRVILSENLNLAESARLLHCHYNTMRRRVRRLEELLGPFMTDADSYFAIALALRLKDFRADHRPGPTSHSRERS